MSEFLQSENFEGFVNEGCFDVVEAGPLHWPIHEVKIKRDKKQNIILTTICDENAESNAKEYPIGTVRVNNDVVLLRNIAGLEVRLKGVLPGEYNISPPDGAGNRKLTETSLVYSIEAKIQDIDETEYLIEWLENVDDSHFLWPDSVRKEVINTTEIRIGESDNEVILKSSDNIRSFGRNSVYIEVGGYELYLSKTIKDSDKKVKSGFILYKGRPPEKEREKIRNCLSFAIGRPFVYLGYSNISKEWALVSFKSVKGYSMGDAGMGLHTMPPCPLGKKYQREIDNMTLSRLVRALYQNYEICNFGHVSWSYWHAVCSPIHIAAVHYGASIEALQKSYIKQNGKGFSTKVISEPKWKGFRKYAIKYMDELDIEDTEKSILVNKINSLNQLPQSLVTDRFLQTLNIRLSEPELNAWKQRNNAAHGNEVEDGDHIKLIREVKIMRVVFNRILLKLVAGSDFYFDYYSIGFPIRCIEDSIPNEVRKTD